MSTKKLLTFGKILALLLLISFSVTAKTTFAPNEFQNPKTLDFSKEQTALNNNMLQPQVVHVSVTTEHSVKLTNSSFGVLFYGEKPSVTLRPFGQTNVILQDANRCESVSRLLFPYHLFW